MKIPFVTSQESLAELCTEMSRSNFVAIDTEFIREKTYYPQLCLIQVATDTTLACIDPLLVKDLAPLAKILFDSNITKVFHAARQDMEIFSLLFSRPPAPVFDTQIAATLLGSGDQIGYANLVHTLLGVQLDKSQSRTDWLKRPLDTAQVEYAADDVRYLVKVYHNQVEQLASLGRTDWPNADFAELSDPATYQANTDNVWRKLGGINNLRGVQLAIALELVRWREQMAIQKDRPRKHILADELIVDIARLKPKSTEELSSLRSAQANLRDAYGPSIVENVQRALALPKEAWPSLPAFTKPTVGEEATVDVLNALIKFAAHRDQIAPTALCNRKELEQLVQGERDLPILHGWRRQHGGETLLKFLRGELVITGEGGNLVVTPKQ